MIPDDKILVINTENPKDLSYGIIGKNHDNTIIIGKGDVVDMKIPKLNAALALLGASILSSNPFQISNTSKRDYKCDNPNCNTTTRKLKYGRCCCRECYDIILKKEQ